MHLCVSKQEIQPWASYGVYRDPSELRSRGCQGYGHWPCSLTCGLQAGSELFVRVYCTLIQRLKHYHQINKMTLETRQAALYQSSEGVQDYNSDLTDGVEGMCNGVGRRA